MVVKPMLCEKIKKADLPLFLAAVPPNKWIAEVKYDGDRVVLTYKKGKVALQNRRGKDVTHVYPEFQGFTHPHDIVLDGEMCVMKDGKSDFNDGITHRSHCKSPEKIFSAMQEYPCTFVVFDILESAGVNLRHDKCGVRRKVLESLKLKHKDIMLSRQDTDIIRLWKEMESAGEEGVIVKDLDGLYKEGGRSSSWRKVKNIKETDLTFTKYEVHPMGITVENDDEIRCTVNGAQHVDVRDTLDKHGEALITIEHLGDKTPAGKYRQPTFKKLVLPDL